MKILFASSSSGSRGGGEAFLLYLGGALAARGHEAVLWTSTHARMDETAENFARFGEVVRAAYTNTYDRPGRSLSALLDGAAARRAARDWEELQPDLLHINKQNLEDGLDLLCASRLIFTPSVCTIHITQSAAFLGARGSMLRDAVARRGLRRYGGTLVAVSEARKADLERFLGGHGRIEAIPNGVPIPAANREAQRKEMGLAPEDFSILALGRLTPQKRPLLFLETAAKILAHAPDAKFLWIGDGPLAAEWDAKAAELGIAAHVRRLGWRHDAASLLAGGDLFLHVAEYEGMPLAVLEAMAAGLPCAIDEALHRELPFLDETNSIRIAGDWLARLGDRARLRQIGAEAARLAAESFSTDAMARAYEELYRLATIRVK